MKRVGLKTLVLLLSACTPVVLPPAQEVVLSYRYGLVALDAEVVSREEGSLEKVVFRYPHTSPYRPKDLQELGHNLRDQLQARGWELRCQTHNPLPIFGGPQYTLRMSRGVEGVGLFLKPLDLDTYALEVSPASPNPPLDCPPR